MPLHINTNKLQDKFVIAVIAVVVVVIGTYFLTSSHAASPYGSTNADKGSLTIGANIQSDATASDGNYVQFGGFSVPTSPSPADAFVDSIGVNIHINYSSTAYGNYSNLKSSLSQLGVRYIRDQSNGGETGSYQVNQWNDLHTSLGIRLSLILDSRYATANTWVPTLQALGSTVWEAEGQNEPDNTTSNGGNIGLSTAITEQQQLHDLLKANPSTSSTLIASPSWIQWSQASAAQINQTASGLFDYGNIHTYEGGNPSNKIASFITDWKQAYSGKPLVSTEEGWSTVNNGSTPAVQAKYTTRMYLENYSRGIAKTFAYELADEQNDPTNNEDNFGLVNNDWSPKPAYAALQNLISLLKDPGPSFGLGQLNYSLSGDTSTLKNLLLEKRDGTFYLILWNESDTSPNAAATITFGTTVNKVSTVLPDESLTPTATANTVNSLNLTVPDEPLALQITP